MKRSILFNLLLLASIMPYTLFSQITPELLGKCSSCDTCTTVILPDPGESICIYQSPYARFDTLYIPDEDADDLHIRVNFIFLSKNDTTGMFEENNPEHQELIDSIISKIGTMYSDFVNPVSDTSCYVQNGFISGAKIQFNINKMYISDEFGWNNENDSWEPVIGGNPSFCPGNDDWYLNYLDDSINDDPVVPLSVNVYFTETAWYYDSLVVYQTTDTTGPINNMCSMEPVPDIEAGMRIHAPNVFTKYYWMKHHATQIYNQPWDSIVKFWFINSVSSILAHEFTHNLDLRHKVDCDINIANPNIDWPRGLLTPWQLGHAHKVMGLTNLRRRVTDESYNSIPEIITESTYIDADLMFFRDIVIEEGATLTVTCKLYMANNAKIIVKQGAKLVVDGGLISTENGKFWQGIQVWGDKNRSQKPIYGPEQYNHGIVELKNDATIENAIIAIDLWEPGNYQATGGILHAEDAVFRNNAKSIHALHYRNFDPYEPPIEWDYDCEVKNCSFEITEEYPGDVTFYKHVDLAYVNGIDFIGCDFSLDDNALNISDYNHAIAGYDAGFRVYASCTSGLSPCPETDYDRSTFTGFWSAISATKSGENIVAFSVDRADFTNNAFGVRTIGVNNASVLLSDFHVGSFQGCGYGIYTNEATGFAFEENQFSKYPAGVQANYFGISINNSRAINDVYKNDFSGLSYANHSDGVNWLGTFREFGLEYLCNTNTNNYADFYVADFVSFVSRSGIQRSQGSQELMAGNSFSLTGATWHFYNGGEHLVDYYTDAVNTPLTPEIRYRVDLETSETENTCPSHYSGSSGSILSKTSAEKTSIEQDYYNNLADYNSTKALYDSYVDGGNTDSEVFDIKNAQPGDMWALRAQLLGNSPHLSFEVLKEAADKTDVFTEAALFDILAANPDELKKDTLISYLENKEVPLPGYMISLLQQLAGGSTYKTALQKQLADYKHAYSRAAHDIVRSILNDTALDHTQLRNWLDNIGGITSDRQIISSYMAQGNFTDAFTLASMLPALYELKGNDSVEHLFYMDMLTLHQTLFQQGRNTYQLNSTEKANITYIASNSNGVAGSQAKSILEAVYNEYCHTCPNIDGTDGYKINAKVNPNNLGEYFGLDVSVKPNPARDWASFEYSLIDDAHDGVIEIRNASGVIVDVLILNSNKGQTLWDTRNISNGLYVYTIKCDNFSKSGKLVITK